MIREASRLDNPSLEVRIIIEKSCNLPIEAQIMNPFCTITDDMSKKAKSMLEMRLKSIPMAYITGEKEFYGHIFKVTKDVLIPRPDTEIIVEKTIEIAKQKARSSDVRILDLCTGSGAIGASVAYETGIQVCLSDISKEALEIAKYNYKAITGKEADARVGSLLEPWDKDRFDIIATNPPYLTDAWYEETDEDVKKEPSLALLGFGDDGLNTIREIINSAPSYLKNGGVLLIEADYRQIEICARLLSSKGFRDIEIAKDLNNKDRVVYGRRE